MAENTHTFFLFVFFVNFSLLLSSLGRFGIASAEPAAGVHSVKVAVCGHVCMQMVSQVYCIS